MRFSDRLALAWAVILLVLLAGLWSGPNSSLTDMPAARWYDYAIAVIGPWFALRAMGWIFVGSRR